MNAQTKEQFPMEATGEEETHVVGRFVFSKAGFDKAIQIIRNAKNTEGWLVIDEIGPLELKGEGFYEVLTDVLTMRREKILLVVREGLIPEVKKVFVLHPMNCISSVSDL
jgi:nucleoside-triphosphatase THEP1